ncbi:MAG: enoyl-CoA hydratase/isomerase family protein [Actinomycetota bacterium]|nr:enoyl-CoA hydratase/isomerase family protein [Actinomycetota bacterium]
MSQHVHVEDRDGVALVRIDRPPANAMDLALLEEGHAVLRQLAKDEPAAVVLVGREGFFSAGVDLKVVPTLDADGQRAMVAGINRLFAGWYGFPRPVVCAVSGHAIAGGLILALCGDYRVGSTEGRLGLTELRVGIPYPAVAMAVVRAELTPAVARQLVLRAELIDPSRARDWGLVDELAAPDGVLPRALEVATELAALPARAYATIKQQLRGGSLDAALAGDGGPAVDWLDSETAGAAASVLRGDG